MKPLLALWMAVSTLLDLKAYQVYQDKVILAGTVAGWVWVLSSGPLQTVAIVVYVAAFIRRFVRGESTLNLLIDKKPKPGSNPDGEKPSDAEAAASNVGKTSSEYFL